MPCTQNKSSSVSRVVPVREKRKKLWRPRIGGVGKTPMGDETTDADRRSPPLGVGVIKRQKVDSVNIMMDQDPVQEEEEDLKKALKEARDQIAFLTRTVKEMQVRGAQQATKEQRRPVVDQDGFRTVINGAKPRPAASGEQIPETSNRFQNLNEDPVTAVRVSRVPPVYMQVSGTKEAVQVLKDIGVDKECLVAHAGTGKVRVVPKSLEVREKIHEMLLKKQIGHQVFRQRSERPFKAVLCGLSDFSEEEVTEMLQESQQLTVKPSMVVRMRRHDSQRNERVGTAFFTVTFPAGTKMKDLENVKSVGPVMASFRPLWKSKKPPQCSRCQEPGHVRDECFAEPMCVKCGLKHESRLCPVITKESPREALQCGRCGKNGHPANWSGCERAIQFSARSEVKHIPLQQMRGTALARPKQKGNHRVPEAVTEEPRRQGQWARPPPLSQEDVLTQILQGVQQMQGEIRTLRAAQERMAMSFGRKLNLRIEDIEALFPRN